MPIREAKLVLLTADLTGFARAVASADALTVATMLDDWYRRAAEVIKRRGGRVVKFMGDACFATFPEDACLAAVDAARELGPTVVAMNRDRGLRLDLGVNVHLAVVAAGEVGPEDDARYDVLGTGVNHVFMMGRGPGVRISEPVYRQLPDARRGEWDKHKPPAVYSLR
ncbi:MAG: adenylate/guanylate cyclase domain-containing protein [Myxococcales bacterium]|nr:adenylate/guanylate cyclase domain-containing protein [Myxococcales bacterium]